MVKMTIIEALEKLTDLNDEEILVITNAGEPQLTENAIEDILRNAEDPEEVLDLNVTHESIKELDENGYIKSGEALYTVVHEEDEDHRGMSDAEWKRMFHPEPIYHEFGIVGLEAREFIVRSGSQTSARINVPADWIGKKVMVVRLE